MTGFTEPEARVVTDKIFGKKDEINADTDDVHDIDELNGSTTVGRLLEIMEDANAEADKDSFDLEWSYRSRNNINR